MNPKFEVQPKIGVGPVTLGMKRTDAISRLGAEPNSFMKTPLSEHPTDSFYAAGLQIFYSGESPEVDYIEVSRSCNIEILLSGERVLELPFSEALQKLESITGFQPETEDEGYTYEIPCLGLRLWRQSIEQNDELALYFSTIGVGRVNT